MDTQKKEQSITVTIYKEMPGADIHNGEPVTLQGKENAETSATAEKKSAEEKEIAKQEEKEKTDTSGEDG